MTTLVTEQNKIQQSHLAQQSSPCSPKPQRQPARACGKLMIYVQMSADSHRSATTVPIVLDGDAVLQALTLAQLRQKIAKLTKFSCGQCDTDFDQNLMLYCGGRLLRTTADMRQCLAQQAHSKAANATRMTTIVVRRGASGLLGGSGKVGAGKSNAAPDDQTGPEITMDAVYAIFMVQTDYQQKTGVEFALAEEFKAEKPIAQVGECPPMLLKEGIDQYTFGQAVEQFELSFQKEKGAAEDQYTFLYRICNNDLSKLTVGQAITSTEDIQEDFRDIEGSEFEKEKKKLIKKVFGGNEEVGGIISVFIRSKGGKHTAVQKTPVQIFLSKIPYLKSHSTTEAISKILTSAQKSYMENYHSKSLEKKQLEFILLTMSDDQLDKLLLEFQAKYRDEILTYLLKKANQHTLISDKMLSNSPEQMKMVQVRRLINSLQNSFKLGEMDELMTGKLKLMQEQLLHGIVDKFSDTQLVELFMQIIEIDQRKQVIQIIAEHDAKKTTAQKVCKDVCNFWDLLSKERKIEIYTSMDKVQQFKFITSDDYHFSAEQKQKNWDLIGRQQRLNIWKMTKDSGLHDGIIEKPKESNKSQLIQGALNSLTALGAQSAASDKTAANLGKSQTASKSPSKKITKMSGAEIGDEMINSVKNTFVSKFAVSKENTKELRRKLLGELSDVQQACLWSILDELQNEQEQMLQTFVRDDVQNGIKFWKILNHEKKCLFVHQLSEEDLHNVFKAMEMQDQIDLLLFVSQALRDKFKDQMDPEKRQEMFYSRRFQKNYETKMSSGDFINELLSDHFQNSNQVIPFEKIEKDYVQCIPNPYVSHGYITVQIIEPNYKVSNTETKREADVQEEEKNTVNLPEKCQNNRYRFAINHYGEVQETEPSIERNANRLAIISFMQYSQRHGMQCTHSFLAPNPLVCPQHPDHKHCDEIVLYTGHNNEVFFFNKQFDSQTQDCKNFDLCLQIINKQQFPLRGESQRQTSECCFTYMIKQDTELYDFIINGRFYFEKYGSRTYMLNTVPTLITEGFNKYLVFSHTPRFIEDNEAHQKENRFYGGPALYFYSVEAGREVWRIKGGEGLIAYIPAKECQKLQNDLNQNSATRDKEVIKFTNAGGSLGTVNEENTGRLMFLGNAMVLKEKMWNFHNEEGKQNVLHKETDAKKYEGEYTTDRHSAVCISIPTYLGLDILSDNFPTDIQDLFQPESQGILLAGHEEYKNNPDRPWNATVETNDTFIKQNAKVLFIDIKDHEGIFAQRYQRMTPVIIRPHEQRTEEGILKSFTILFQHINAFSFSMIEMKMPLTQEKKRDLQEEIKRLKEEEENELEQLRKSGTDEDRNKVRQKFDKQKEEKKKEAQPPYYRFKCKYNIPGASDVIRERTKNQSFPNMYIQVSSVNELLSNKAKEYQATERSEKSSGKTNSRIKRFDTHVTFYNVTDSKISYDSVEGLPSESDTRNMSVPLDNEILLAYAKNIQPNKAGVGNISAFAGPILPMTNDSFCASWLYRESGHIQNKSQLNWVVPTEKQGMQTDWYSHKRQKISIDYPMLVYNGYMPDNRELVIANLARKNAPQQILHLNEIQFLTFVTHNNAQRSAKIGFLGLKDGYVRLCWLLMSQVFKYRNEDDLSNLKIVEIDIKFQSPILAEYRDFQRVEFINSPGKKLDESNQGCLVIQTQQNIYLNNCSNGFWQNITMGTMQPNMMIRGYNSYIYYVKKVGETDDAVMAMKFNYMSGRWQVNEVECHKVNEGCVIALELDPDNRDRTDSVYTIDNQLIEEQPEVLNKFFVIDDKETLFHIRQKGEDEPGARYEVFEERNLGFSRELGRELIQHKLKGSSRCAITSRCITINDKNFNFFNGNEWQLDITRKGIDDIEENEDASIDQQTDKLKKEVNQAKANPPYSKVNSVRNIRWTSRQLLEATYFDYDESKKRYIQSNSLITKLLPGSRRQDLLGLRGLRDLASLNMISDNLFLVRFRGSDLALVADYWTVISSHGQLMPIPEKAKKHLIWSNFSAGDSRISRFDTNVVLYGGHERVISFGSDVRFKEKHITKIQFTRSGEVGWITQYKKNSYEDKLRDKIVDQLMNNHSLRKDEFKNKGALTEFKAKQMVKTLQYQKTILSRHSGDLYRIASIVVDDSFTDDAIVNPLRQQLSQKEKDAQKEKEEKAKENDKDKIQETNFGKKNEDILQLGIFEVEKRRKDTNQSSLNIDISHNYKLLGKWSGTEEVSFNIVLFLCKSKKERFHLEQAGFTMVCNQICWSYPTEPYIHLLDVRQIHAAKQEQASKGIKGLVNNLQGLFKGQQSTVNVGTDNNAIEDNESIKTDAKDDDFKRVSSVKSSPQKVRVALNQSDSEGEVCASEGASGYKPPNTFDGKSAPMKDLDLFKSSITQKKPFSLGTTLSLLKAMKTKVLKFKEKQASDDDTETASDEEHEQNMLQQTRILWKQFQTHIIDLSVMCDNENDKYSMYLSEMPQNMTYSLDAQETIESGENFTEPKINENLLQITVKDRLCIFDVGEEFEGMERKVKEIHVFNAVRQFINPERFVECGFDIIRAYEDPTKAKDGYLVDRIIQNRCKELCFQMQTRLNLDSAITQEDFDKLPQTPICLSIFKKYAEIDLMELKRIQEKIDKHGRLDNIDFQTTLSVFKGHSAFSIFAESEKFHEQMLTQVQEQEFEDELQEDETLVENNVKKRLYRTLIMPTPDMNPKAAQSSSTNVKKENEVLEAKADQKQVQDEATVEKEDSKEEQNNQSKINDENSKTDETPEKKISFGSVLKKCIYSPNARIKSCLLSIVNKCNDCTIGTFCGNQDAFGELIKDLSSNAIEVISDSFVSTPFTKRIQNTKWHPDMQSVLTIRTDNSLITQDQVDKAIQKILTEDLGAKESEETKTQVEVRMLDLSWLLADRKTFVHFTTVLDLASNDQIYTTELLKTLLVEFWEENYQKILWRCLLPWLAYALCAMMFFIQALRGEREDANRAWITILGICTLTGLGYQLFIEIRQSKNDELITYFTNIVNLMDIFQYFSTLWIVSVQMIGLQVPDRETQRVMAALSTLFLWIKVLDWCQLFAPTSFFIKLITETIYDIRHFFLIFLCALFMFGVPMYILQLNRDVAPVDDGAEGGEGGEGDEEEDMTIVEEKFGNIWLLNAFYNQYMLSLGEFTIDAFDGGPQVYLCYIFFLCATFFTQITFLNMLIALMGDTYGKVMESQETYQLLTQRSIMGDYTALIDDPVDPKDYRPFLFIIQQKLEGDSDPNSAWEGNLTVIKKSIESGINGLQKQLDKKLLALDAGIKASSQHDARFDKESRGQYVKIMEKFASFDRRFELIDPEKTDKIFEIVNRQQTALKNITAEMKIDNSQGQHRIRDHIHSLRQMQNESNQDFRNEFKELRESQQKLIEAQEALKEIQQQQPNVKQQPADDAGDEDLQIADEQPPAAQAQQKPKAQVAQAVAGDDVAEPIVIPQSAESARAQSERLEQAIADSQRVTNQVVSRLDQQQQSIIQEISNIKGQQDQVRQEMSTNLNQLTGSLNESQNGVLQQLQAMREEISALQQQQQVLASQQQSQLNQQSSVQPQPSGVDAEQIIGGVQQLMGSMLEQMQAMQQQMQQEMLAANEALKKEIIEASQQPDDF